ncbi:hypothetical protein OC834_005217 [Tilletia horrida]|nr:hypothetical protein OC834_005217 [Tilletia horrida]
MLSAAFEGGGRRALQCCVRCCRGESRRGARLPGASGAVHVRTYSSSTSPRTVEADPLYHGPRKGDKVIVGVSGGVDSSVSALLLAQQDFDLEAVFMRNWATDDGHNPVLPSALGEGSPSLPFDQSTCTWREDYESAQAVCRHLSNLPLRLLDFQKEYWNAVFDPALSAWAAGETPNPDVACNRQIKFGVLMDHILGQAGPSHRAVWLATGHYSRLRLDPVAGPDGQRSVQLLRAVDPVKDQSYYLSSVPASRLRQAHFPIGHLLKSEVREIARRHSLPSAARKESMGLCFVGDHKPPTPSVEKRGAQGEPGPFAKFLDSYLDSTPGPLVSPSGQVLGHHNGLHTLTIGQSARIPGQKERWYVARKPRGSRQSSNAGWPGGAEQNSVLVVPGKDHPLLQCRRAVVSELHWVAGRLPPELENGEALMQAWAQVRHRQKAVPCSVKVCSPNGAQAGRSLDIEVSFPTPVTAVAPGQVLALWADEQHIVSDTEETTAETVGGTHPSSRANTVCLGSGTIADVWTLADEAAEAGMEAPWETRHTSERHAVAI